MDVVDLRRDLAPERLGFALAVGAVDALADHEPVREVGGEAQRRESVQQSQTPRRVEERAPAVRLVTHPDQVTGPVVRARSLVVLESGGV